LSSETIRPGGCNFLFCAVLTVKLYYMEGHDSDKHSADNPIMIVESEKDARLLAKQLDVNLEQVQQAIAAVGPERTKIENYIAGGQTVI
jgi:hypothetical protein